MTSNAAVVRIIQALEAAGVPYLLAGSYSSNFYGVARSTMDADFVVQLGAHSVAAVRQQLGAEFEFDPQMSFETITGTSRYVLRAVRSQFKIELFLLSDEPHDQERFARRQELPYLGRLVFLPTAEDVVITKLRWSRAGKRHKDIDDVKNLIAVQRDRLDWSYVEHWCDQHGTRTLLDEVRRSLPPP